MAAERLAQFEEQRATVYRPKDDPVWAEVHAAAGQIARGADERIAEVCREHGIPKRFRPGLEVDWCEHGVAGRRAELRKVAQTRFAANAKRVKSEIERRSVELHRLGRAQLNVSSGPW